MGVKEFSSQQDRAMLAFLLHFLPSPKFDDQFSDRCIEDILKRHGCTYDEDSTLSHPNTPAPKLLEDNDHAA